MEQPKSSGRQLFNRFNLRRPQIQIALVSIVILTLLGVGARIIMADTIVTMSLNSTNDPIIEGNSPSTKIVNYDVKLSQAVGTGQQIVVRMTTTNTAVNSATLGTDYSATTTDLTFNPGESQKSFPVTIIGDTTDELNEGFIVKATILSATGVGSITPSVGSDISTTAIIIDDDNPTVDTISDPVTAFENAGTINFVVTLDKVSTLENISIAYKTVDGTATSGSDFTGTLTGTLLISTNHLTGTISIPLINDTIDEVDESFTIELLPASSLSVNSPFNVTTATGTIKDDNDPPSDIALSASSVDENQTSGTTIGTLSATDADSTNFTYSLVTGTGSTDNASFSITGTTLKTAAVFNYETKASYSIRVRATDDGTPNMSFDKVFTITVNDLNEAPTDISLTPSSVVENAVIGTTVGTLSATDPDASSTFSYALIAGTGDTDNASFSISGTTLQTAAVFDYETQNSYSIRVEVTDNGTPGLTFEKVFTITVTNANEAPTDISLAPSSVNENAAAITTVGTLSATDPDTGSTFTYALVTGTGDTDNASFSITG
ncbi:MAG: hypothetical protein HGA19_09925, partial [Oscillochloris sp.]|nr:hypothetical protein [Oscillochloris sp.]